MVGKRSSKFVMLALPLAAQSVVQLTALAAGTSSSWGVDADGSWSNPANWSGQVPNAVDETASFGPVISAPRTITVDAPEALSEIAFNSASRYTIAGSGTITFSSSKNAGNVANTGGSQTISAPLVLANNMSFGNLVGSPTLTISGPISAAGKSITTQGGGTIEFSNLRAKSLNVTAGTTRILPNGTSAGASSLATLTISFNTGFDLSNNDLQLTSGSFSDVALLIGNGNRGIPALFSSNARADSAHHELGELTGAQYKSFGGRTTFDGFAVNDTDVLVKYTIPGDTNFDGVVNALDFNALAGTFGNFGKWVNGDFNYDGFVNSMDFTALVQNFGRSLSPAPAPALGTTVPEPTWVGVLGCVGIMMVCKRY